MKFDAKRKISVSVFLVFALALSIFAGTRPTNTSVSFNTENYVGAIDAEDYTSLTVGAMGDVDAYSITSSANGESTVTQNQLFVDDTSAEGTTYGYTNIGFAQVKGNLNVRSGPSSDAEIAGKLTNNNAVEIVGTSEDGLWYQITSGDVEGYVSTDYIVAGSEAEALASQLIATYAIVNVDTLRVRLEPSTSASVVTNVNNEEALLVTGVDGDWVQIDLDDETAYVAKQYVTLNNQFTTGKTIEEICYGDGVSDVRASLVEYAMQFLGNPYVWGGTSLTNGVDCSGFTMKVYEHFGIYLPHSSAEQPSYGTKIKASEAQPGDLFFYSRGGSGIGHVAIYIGDGQIIHASGRRTGIKISSAYYKTPICVVRYLD